MNNRIAPMLLFFSIPLPQQLTTWADTVVHLHLLMNSMGDPLEILISTFTVQSSRPFTNRHISCSRSSVTAYSSGSLSSSSFYSSAPGPSSTGAQGPPCQGSTCSGPPSPSCCSSSCLRSGFSTA